MERQNIICSFRATKRARAAPDAPQSEPLWAGLRYDAAAPWSRR
jgi:hypothetical protein